LQETCLSSLMSKTVTCIAPGAPLADALKLMANKKYSCVIISEDDYPIGIITERDLVKVLLTTRKNPGLIDSPVRDFMSSPIITLHDNDTLFDAIVVNRTEKLRHLPVINEHNKLVGLVTQTDLTNAYFHLIEMQAEIIENTIAEKTQILTAENEELLLLSMEDHLMGIGNRRAMEVDLQHTHEHAAKNQQDYSIILMDIDYFKNYNDHYGHTAGDDALKKTGVQLRSSIRSSDRLYRYGGEEILILLPDCNAEQAHQSAQRHIQSLANLGLPHTKSPFQKLTASAGVGHINATQLEEKSWQDVVKQADKYLYQAKQAGRNKAISAVNSLKITAADNQS